ncbi:MAG: tripartite tricarboxylate transporter TctB family protein [Sneathiellaceae bacterium]
MPRADFLFSLVLIAVGIAAAAEAWRMPRFENLGVHPMTAPGLTPGLLGLVVAGLGLALLLGAVRAGGWQRSAPATAGQAAERRSTLGRVALALLLTLGYAAGLVGHMPFWLATAIFVFLFVALFEWPLHEGWRRRLRGLAIAAVLAVATGLAVTYLFEEIFLVQLP